jgi:hypothetical protein
MLLDKMEMNIELIDLLYFPKNSWVPMRQKCHSFDKLDGILLQLCPQDLPVPPLSPF